MRKIKERRRFLLRLCDTYPNIRCLRWFAVLWLIVLPVVLLPQASSANSNLTNVGLSALDMRIDKERVAFVVRESDEGTDLNGDGDTDDDVLHVFDDKKGTTTNVGLAIPGGDRAIAGVQIDKERVAFRVGEPSEGTDLNGDSDTGDFVLHVFNAKKGTTTNVGLAAEHVVRIDKERVAFLVSESSEGTDLNGDSDTGDSVLHVFDAKKGTTTNVGLAALDAQIDKEQVFFVVLESDEGTDLNGDGDTGDLVLHVFDAKKGTITNVGLAISDPIRIDKGRVAFLVSEFGEGTDLNDDGDTNDEVLHVLDVK